MHAYAFLGSAGFALFDGIRWPLPTCDGPGDWIEAPEHSPIPGRLRAHLPAHLPYWLDDELWSAELAEPVTPGRRMLTASRGRLLARVDAWNTDAARDLVGACSARVQELVAVAADVDPARVGLVAGLARDIALYAGEAPTAASAAGTATHIAATAAGVVAGSDSAVTAERAWQAGWLAARLDLPDGEPE